MCKKSCLLLSIVFAGLIGGCSSESDAPKKEAPETEASITDNNMNGALWMQTSAEYYAASIQSYRTAGEKIEEAKNTPFWTAMLEQKGQETMPSRLAVVLDIDETVLDNSPYLARQILQGKSWDSESWDHWVSLASAPAVPGAVEFIKQLKENGIEAVYISNRECIQREESKDRCPQKAETAQNLRKVGLEFVKTENVLLKNEIPEWTSEKQSRRAYVAKEYRVLMLIGDDLGDFLPAVKKNISAEQRRELVDEYTAYWGEKWFVLANPTYGSWLNIIGGSDPKHLRAY